MSLCFDCGKTNADQAYEQAKQEAKRLAVEKGEPIAVYRDGNEYKFINAFKAINDNIPYHIILSQYH